MFIFIMYYMILHTIIDSTWEIYKILSTSYTHFMSLFIFIYL